MSPKFHDGDVLLVRSIEHTDIEIGNIGIFIVDGQTAFVKELGDGELVSLNSKKYGNIKFTDHNDFICKGVVLGTTILLDWGLSWSANYPSSKVSEFFAYNYNTTL